MLRPDLKQFAEALIHVQRGLACGRPGFGRSRDEAEREAGAAPTPAGNSSSSSSFVAAASPSLGHSLGGGGASVGRGQAVSNQSADAASTHMISFEDAARRVQQALRRAQELEEALEARLAKSMPRDPSPPPPPPPSAVNASALGNLIGDVGELNASGQLRRGEWINEETGLPFSELRKKLLGRPCFKEEQTGLGTRVGCQGGDKAAIQRNSAPFLL